MLPSSISSSPPLPSSANPAILTAPHHTEVAGYSEEKVWSWMMALSPSSSPFEGDEAAELLQIDDFRYAQCRETGSEKGGRHYSCQVRSWMIIMVMGIIMIIMIQLSWWHRLGKFGEIISNLNQIRESESAARRRGCDCLTSWATSDYSARSLYPCVCVSVCHLCLHLFVYCLSLWSSTFWATYDTLQCLRNTLILIIILQDFTKTGLGKNGAIKVRSSWKEVVVLMDSSSILRMTPIT